MIFWLVVILKINLQGVFACPAERDPVIPGDAHRPALWAAVQAVEAKACDVHILGPSRYFQQLQDTHALPDLIGADPARLASEVDLFEPLMTEAPDYCFSVNYLVYSVNSEASRFHETGAICSLIDRW
jgi:hypothetical protein